MKRKRIAALAAAASLALAGCGSQAATSDDTTSGTQQQTQPDDGQPPGRSSDDLAARLAEELGVSESKVRAALEDVMPQGGPPNGGQAPPSGTPSADDSTTSA